jgi:hypothetical protein
MSNKRKTGFKRNARNGGASRTTTIALAEDLFDHLVGADQQLRRNFEAKRPGASANILDKLAVLSVIA